MKKRATNHYEPMYSTKRHCEYRVSGVRSTDSCSLPVVNIAWSIYRKCVYVGGGGGGEGWADKCSVFYAGGGRGGNHLNS